MRAFSFIYYFFCKTANASRIKIEPLTCPCMHHHRHIGTIKISSVQKLRFTAVIFYNSFFLKRITKTDFYKFFGGHGAKSHFAAPVFCNITVRQSCRNSEKRCGLRIVSAYMCGLCNRIALGVLSAYKRIHFPQNKNTRSFSSGIKLCAKPGYISGRSCVISYFFEFAFKIFACFFFFITCFGVFPDMSFRFQNQF